MRNCRKLRYRLTYRLNKATVNCLFVRLLWGCSYSQESVGGQTLGPLHSFDLKYANLVEETLHLHGGVSHKAAGGTRSEPGPIPVEYGYNDAAAQPPALVGARHL